MTEIASNDLHIPRMTTCKWQKAISFRGAKTWNQLSNGIKEASSLQTKTPLAAYFLNIFEYQLLFAYNIPIHSPVLILLHLFLLSYIL